MISNFQVFVNNFFKFFIKQGYKDSNLEMTESESVALPFGDSPSFIRLRFLFLIARDECYYITGFQKNQPLFLIFFKKI